MSAPHDTGVLGRTVEYPDQYDPGLLFAIPRASGRAALAVDAGALPFIGADRWHAYELSWLDARGKPCVATARFEVAATTPQLVESKSIKLYLNAFNGTRFDSAAAVRERIAHDLSQRAGGAVTVEFGLPGFADDAATDVDGLDVAIDDYGPPNTEHLRAGDGDEAVETLSSHLLKSNCPVTGQPDWASVRIAYRGPRLDRAALLRYLVSFRDHCEFHEQCVERIFTDVLRQCKPNKLAVYARYTRRGGLDINPWRANFSTGKPPNLRAARQ